MEGNSIASFENLCKIFEMRIRLDKDKDAKTPLDILNNYEKYSKKIDSIYNSQFQKELKPLISPAITLEKEEDRLRRLIKLLEERLDKRIELEDRFYNSTGKYISGLQIIVSEDELEDKKERLSLVSRYLETSTEINNVIESINKLKDSLLDEENRREEYEDKNRIMEDELYSSFMTVVKTDEYYRNISEEDINSQLEAIRSKVSETEETLDITKESIGSLITNGLEDDYASYVEEAERSYFNYKNKELMLKIYKLVSDFEDDFKLMCAKREKIGNLIDEQKELRESLTITTENELLSFEKILLVQNNTLDNEREVLENIANYTSRIRFKEERLEELSEVNNSVEILAILREYGLIDTYDTEEVENVEILEEIEEELVPEIPKVQELELPSLAGVEESIIEEIYDPYRIVEVKDYPRTLNIGLAKLKGESVREKVNKKLNPKKEETTFENITSSIAEPAVVEEQKEIPEAKTMPIDTPTLINTEIAVEPLQTKLEEKSTKEIKIETPVWEIPTQLEPKPITFENENNLPLWDMLPIEGLPSVEDKKEEVSIDIVTKPEEKNKNDMFWIPVSESKLETKDFPNINIPLASSVKGSNDFSFPTIND